VAGDVRAAAPVACTARRTLTSRMSSSGTAGEECVMQRRDGDGNRMAQRRGENEPASALGAIGGRRTWSWRHEPWATRKTAAVGLE
jgi:hypothetical protein